MNPDEAGGESKSRGQKAQAAPARGFTVKSVWTWKELRRVDRYARLGSGIDTEKQRDGQEGGRKERGVGEALYC